MEVNVTAVDDSLSWEVAGELLDKAIECLSEEDRDAICMRFFEERTYGELALRLGLKENAARMRVNRAVEKLQTVLEKRGVKSSVAALGGIYAGHSLVSAPAGLASSVTTTAFAVASSGIGALATVKVLWFALSAVAAFGVAGWMWKAGEQLPDEGLVVATEAEETVASKDEVGLSAVVELTDSVALTQEPVGSLEDAVSSAVELAVEIEDLDPSFVLSRDGFVVVSLRGIKLSKTHGTRTMDFDGGARYVDGSAIVLSEEQAQKIKVAITNRVGGVGLSEMGQRSFKSDLCTVVGDDIATVLGTERELEFLYSKLVIR